MGAVERALAIAPQAAGDNAGPPPAEFAAYLDEPAQMRSGAGGKSGFLRLGFERRGDRTILADLESRTPYLAQRALHCDEALPDMAWLFMITTTGCVLQGDRMALEVALGAGRESARHDAVGDQDPHDGRQLRARRPRWFTLDEGAYLEFLPDPLIPHRHARFASDTRITLHRPRRCFTRKSCNRDASTIIRTSVSAPPCCRSRPRPRGPAGCRCSSRSC